MYSCKDCILNFHSVLNFRLLISVSFSSQRKFWFCSSPQTLNFWVGLLGQSTLTSSSVGFFQSVSLLYLCFRLKHLPLPYCECGIRARETGWHPQAWSARENPLPQADISVALSWYLSHWNLRSLRCHMKLVIFFPKASLHHRIEMNFIWDRKHSSGTNSTFLTQSSTRLKDFQNLCCEV